MNLDHARKDYLNELWAHGWAFLVNQNRAGRQRDDALTDARDAYYTAIDLEAAL